jgi:hypothetical protein
MQRPGRRVFQGVFNALMLGALGVGASQVLASPAEASTGAFRCQAWQQTACTEWCRSMNPYDSYIIGKCTSIGTTYYDCVCDIGPEPL